MTAVKRLRTELGGIIEELPVWYHESGQSEMVMRAYVLCCAVELYLTLASSGMEMKSELADSFVEKFLDTVCTKIDATQSSTEIMKIYTELTASALSPAAVLGEVGQLIYVLGDTAMELKGTVKCRLLRLRTLAQVDTSTLSAWDSMSLDEMDYVID